MRIASCAAARPSRFDANARCILSALFLNLIAAAVVGVIVHMASFVAPARAQPTALTQAQSDALKAYEEALADFKAILAQRRAQIDAKQRLPNLPGQAIYLARIKVISTYKDLTDALPSRIGRPNKFDVPPAYFDAEIEPLIEEYAALFKIMQAPPARRADLQHALQGRRRPRHGNRARQRPRRGHRRDGRPHQPRHFLRRDQRQPEHRQRTVQHLQGQPADGHFRRPQRSQEVGGDQAEGSGARSRGRHPRRRGGGARRQGRSALQSLDRGAQRPDERARRALRAASGDHADTA